MPERNARNNDKENQAHLYRSYEEMLATKPDGVVICSENSKHRPLVEMAAAAGVHVLCEKPIATTLDDAKSIISACERAGVVLMTAFPMRFSTPLVEVKQRLDAGDPITVLDVRHSISLELDPEMIPGALNLLLEDIDHRHHEIPRDREIVLYCTCPNEVSSARTALLLKKKGIHRVRPLEGGLDAWRERKFPVERRMNRVG